MTKEQLFSYVDHTQLKAFATWEDIKKLCDEAIEYKTASVCVPPCYIKRIADTYGDKINICTVVGFPLGYSTTEAKGKAGTRMIIIHQLKLGQDLVSPVLAAQVFSKYTTHSKD